MSESNWNAVEHYVSGMLLPPDPMLGSVLESIDAAGMPQISVAPPDGMLLNLLVRLSGAQKILEIGTLGGYSTICMARALPSEGRLITLEYEPRHAELARANIERAGLSAGVEIRVGRALDSLPQLEAEGAGPFDMFFIDADKPSNPDYVQWALRLSRPGSLVIVDNVIRHGNVIDPQGDASVLGVRRMLELIHSEPRLSATAIQTVSSKGHDGMLFALVN